MPKISKEIPDLDNIQIRTVDFKKIMLDDYFKKLLLQLFKEGDEFSPKKPFGNGAWKWDIYESVAKRYPKLSRSKLGIFAVDERMDIAILKRIEKVFENSRLYEKMMKEARLL